MELNVKRSFKASLPRLIGDLSHQNQTLKVFCFLSLALSVLCLSLSLILLKRKPVVIALSADGTVAALESSELTENQVSQALRKYVALRYSWTPVNQNDHLNKAKAFVADDSIKAFEKMAQDLFTFSKGKDVVQKTYIDDLKIDLPSGQAVLVADRFNQIQGLKAATNLNLRIFFRKGPRSLENPWGVFITKEEEVSN